MLFRVPLNGLPYWIAIVLTAALLGRDWRPQGSGSVGVVMLASAAVAYESGEFHERGKRQGAAKLVACGAIYVLANCMHTYM